MAPLSTTALIGQLKQGLFKEFIETVNKHFEEESSDDASAVKVVKTVAAFVYSENIVGEFVDEMVEIISTCCEVIIDKDDMTDIFLKELFGNISHLMNRLVKQEVASTIVTLATTFFRIHEKVVHKETLNNMAHNLYVMLWNFAFKLEPSIKLELEVLSLINIQFCALKFFTLLDKSDKFSLAKLVDKVMSSTRLVFRKNSSQTVSDLLGSRILDIVNNPVMEEQGVQKWEICCFLVEMLTKYAGEDKLKEMMLKLKDAVGPGYLGEVEYLQFLLNLKVEKTATKVLDASIQASSLPSLLSLADILLSSSISSLHAEMLPICSFTLMGLTKMSTPTTALVATRLLTSLSTWLLAVMKSTSSPQLVSLSSMLVTEHSRCFSLLPSSVDGKHVKSSVTSLTINSFNMAVVLFNKKLYSPCRQLLEESCRSCQAWSQLEQQRAASLRPRLKLLAEVLLKMGQFKECLRMFSNSLLVMLRHETEAVQADKIAEGGRFWISVKREWVMAEADSTEVHKVSVMSLLGEGVVFGMPGTVSPVVLHRLGRLETGWYRQGYLPGCDLTQSWVSCAGTLLRLSNSSMDRGMVLLEQAWVFWLGDNLEDLEMGARCAEKAVALLSGLQLCGLAWYWRFMCEHRLLMLQVQGAMVRAGEERMVGRRDREGVGEEEQETEPTPAYPGLEMAVQIKLVGFLEEALDVWESEEFVVVDWMGGKVMLQFMLATAWEMERMGHSGVRAFIIVRDLGLRLGELEETLLAMVELVRIGNLEELGEVVRVGKEIEMKKPNSAVACQVGLAVAHVAMTRGERELAREVLEEMVESAVVKLNSLKCNLVGSEARLMSSILEVQVGDWVATSKHDHDQLGPLEVALDAWKLAVLCYKWWEQDVRTPSSQDPFLLWMGPRLCVLQLRCVEQLSNLFRQISAPRELKCYLKEGLKVAQWQCLPLQAANLLVHLAEAHLLCDDEVAASVQVDGVMFVLSSLVGEKEKTTGTKNKVMENDNSQLVKLPGQDDQSMSPTFVRQHHSPPPFLEHPSSCSCLACSLPLLHRTILSTSFTQAWCLVMAGQMEEANTLYTLAKTMYTSIMLKYNTMSTSSRHQLSQVYLTSLLQEGECRAWHADWDTVMQVVMARQEVINTMSEQWLAAHPALLVSHFEQISSVRDAREKEEKEEERRKAAVQEALVQRMEKLEVVETSSSNTPTAERPSRSIGAPHKRIVPSLGLGDPDTLAKNLEETLSLVKEDNEEQEQQVKMKPVSRRGGRPRLFSSADLVTSNIKKVVPKLVLTEGTPRKFFKSKGSISEVVNTPEDPPASTPSVSSSSSGSKPKSKLPKSESQSKLSLVKKSSSSHSLKENIYEIFEDDKQHTPAPDTRKTSSRTSTRKAGLTSACDSSLVTKSVSKPPRMAKLAEAEQPTRSSARRKAALKRL